MKATIVLLSAIALSACVETAKPAGAGGEVGTGRTDLLTGNVYANDVVGFFGLVDPDYPRAGVTYASFDPARLRSKLHVEYYSPDGTVYLWFGGSRIVQQGEWKIEGENTCLRRKGGADADPTARWDCGSPKWLASLVVGMVTGDPYGLQTGTAPDHDLRSCRLPTGMLLKKQMTCLPGF